MVKFCKQKLRHFYALTFIVCIVKKPRSISSGAHHTINPVRFRVTFQIESTANRRRTDKTCAIFALLSDL